MSVKMREDVHEAIGGARPQDSHQGAFQWQDVKTYNLSAERVSGVHIEETARTHILREERGRERVSRCISVKGQEDVHPGGERACESQRVHFGERTRGRTP